MSITQYVLLFLPFLNLSRQPFFCRFKSSPTPSSISKGAPDFCTVYVLSKGKVSSVRTASRPAPHTSPLLVHINNNLSNHDINHPAEQICSRRMNLRGLSLSFFLYMKRTKLFVYCSHVLITCMYAMYDTDRASMKPHGWQDESMK